MNTGQCIVLYGINNLGKSTQAKKLVERMNQEGYTTTYLKYPIYDLHPSGTLLNQYLREGNPLSLSSREVQTIYALNRTQFQPELDALLSRGTHVVAEDYTGTGIAWGIGSGVEESYLHTINDHLRKEDIAFLFDGERFVQSTEQNHTHETNTSLLASVRTAHQYLGKKNNWIPVDANQSIETIHEFLWETVRKHIS